MRRLAIVACCVHGCTCNGPKPDAHLPKADAHEPAAESAPRPDSTSSVTGDWSGRAFQTRSALAQLHPKWITITLLQREAACSERSLRDSDQALQFTIPTGPSADLFAGRPLAIPLNLSGAGGISSVPAGQAWARLDSVEPHENGRVRGALGFSWRAGREDDAPQYRAHGSFDAVVCDAQAIVPSMPALDWSVPVAGTVSGHKRSFPSFLAFVQKDAQGKEVIRLKGFGHKDVSCYSDKPNTPYLFGPEIGPGPDGTYFVGGPMPADWVMQMVDNKFSERSVHAGDGSGVLELDEVRTGRNGVVRGKMMAATVAEDDEAWKFEVAGTFEASICDVPLGTVAP